MTATLKTVAIKASNSLDFLKHAFRLYESGAPFTVERAGLDLSHYPGLDITERLATSPGGGWGQHAFTPGMSDAPAQILFSSGTEGHPKPIVLSQPFQRATVRATLEGRTLSEVASVVASPVGW